MKQLYLAFCLCRDCDCDERGVQDENRHGDFFAAIMKARPEMLNDWQAQLWSRFFCLSVYITMYLNDNQRSAFYESLGLDTVKFNQHVIIETNKSTARLFPQVRPAPALLCRPHCECPAAVARGRSCRRSRLHEWKVLSALTVARFFSQHLALCTGSVVSAEPSLGAQC